VEGVTVEFDDQAMLRPEQVDLVAVNHGVRPRRRQLGLANQGQEGALRHRAGEGGSGRHERRQGRRARASWITGNKRSELAPGGELLGVGLGDELLEVGCGQRCGEVDDGAGGGGCRDAVDGGELVAIERGDPVEGDSVAWARVAADEGDVDGAGFGS
jgi:hypothetical protein